VAAFGVSVERMIKKIRRTRNRFVRLALKGRMSQQQPQGYYHPPAPQWAPYERTSGQSIAVLVLGVASLTVFWGVAGVVALFLAPGAKREIAASNGMLSGRGMIRAGVICSWVSIAITAIVLIGLSILFGIMFFGGDGNAETVFATTVPS
jgi:hypothetical protein